MRLFTYLVRLPRSVKIACLALILLFVYLSLAKIDIVSPGSGVITGSEDKIDITSSGSGFINRFDLRSGSKVQRGEVLFSYTNLDSYYKEKSLADLVRFSKQRIVELETDLELLNFLKAYEFPVNNSSDSSGNPANVARLPADLPTQWDNTGNNDNNNSTTNINNAEDSNKINNHLINTNTKNNTDNNISEITQDKQDSQHDQDSKAANNQPATTTIAAVNTASKNKLAEKPASANPVNIINIAATPLPTTPVVATDNGATDADTDNSALRQKLLAELDNMFSRHSQDQSLTAFKFYQEYKAIINEKENQHKRQQETTRGIAELTTQIAMLNSKETLLRRSGAPQVDIINTGSDISKIRSQIIQERISLLSLENDTMRTRRDFDDRLLSRIYDADQQLAKLKKEQIENLGELELLKNKIESNSVLAPVDGVVLDIVRNFTEGSYVEQSQLIMKLKKTQVKKVVEAKFDAKYRPFIHNDGIVKVVINTPGYKKYYTGHIEKISADSFTDDHTHLTSRFYKVEIRVDNENFNLNNNSEGIQVSVYAISKRMTIINYLTALVNSNIVFNVW